MREGVARTIGSDARSIVRDDRFALRMHVEHETAAVGKVGFSFDVTAFFARGDTLRDA